MTRATLSQDWLGNRAQSGEYLPTANDVDRDLLYHYVRKSILNGNFSCPVDKSMERVLEIAYSSGYWMMEMATDFPNTQFFGIDLESSAPDLVYPRNCFFGQGDYLKGLPYQDNFFDMVRLDMMHLRSLSTLDPILFLLSEVFRVTKKGGYIEFWDSDYNSSPLLERLTGIRVGNDHIEKLLTEQGFVNVTQKNVAIPLGKGSTVGEFTVDIIKSFIASIDAREDDLLYLIEECEKYDSRINVFSGFGQKL
ncbi:uncharacterized protein OCT59_022518 [Rhizophagus irregularis]|uniref:Uncharacterized protein n=3 Tax=Rhizophagus irregularis TaxID=588596 RepID=A0A2I1FBA6_9GLOM|nr:hypothetical protein RhiirB3_419653 [Rhizophagus irregularis]UZO29021.1 hypothetical protein OCT59_022518 [Rhizophagus irregularis]GBC50991.1 class I SAM-dependent methyltransferase [Rhizophagus irregularis DAOM 181602=DAOM 197198]CAB4486416.1 unnamed protein product [Rhizophagus irregularis]CAB5372702.1 unnamed protein product [Rhizophagus irregularis]